MGTLATELAPHTGDGRPRIYADANIPNGAVAYMRHQLQWDVLFVMEDEALRRGRDIEHFRLARQLARTLLTFDRDYADDRRFPPAEGPGVIVISAPDERRLRELLQQLDRELFRAEEAPALPLWGAKLLWHTGATIPARPGACTPPR